MEVYTKSNIKIKYNKLLTQSQNKGALEREISLNSLVFL